jgi:hypothetical protein
LLISEDSDEDVSHVEQIEPEPATPPLRRASPTRPASSSLQLQYSTSGSDVGNQRASSGSLSSSTTASAKRTGAPPAKATGYAFSSPSVLHTCYNFLTWLAVLPPQYYRCKGRCYEGSCCQAFRCSRHYEACDEAGSTTIVRCRQPGR